jgi:RNA polymerase sigma factor (TIGR02999 family)
MAAIENDVTRLLHDLAGGDPRAADALLPQVYDELRALAHYHLAAERREHTLQPTALVHEVYLKLVDQDRAQWKDRAHFIAVGAQAMRRILVDHARGRKRLKRGGDAQRLGLHDGLALAGLDERTDLLALDDALTELSATYPNQARVVELRFFGGLTVDEAALVLDVTTRTVERHWQFARAWLFRAVQGGAA